MIEPKECYELYFSIKQHFKQKGFDYFKSRSALKPVINRNWSRMTTPERRIYEKAVIGVRTLDRSEIAKRFVANMTARTPDLFVFDALDSDYHLMWLGRIHSMSNVFREELNRIVTVSGTVAKSLKPSDKTNLPVLYGMLMTGEISMETFSFLCDFQPKIIPYMDRFFDPMDTIWKMKKRVAEKYPAFLRRININRDRLAETLKEFAAIRDH